ncbi:hypothetical protein H4R26_005753, partial [Coemansia thaxteri]
MSATTEAHPGEIEFPNMVRNHALTVYVPEYVNRNDVQKCLQDERTKFVPVDSSTFSAHQLLIEKHARLLALEKDHLTLFNRQHQQIKFSYKSRNAVLSRLWRTSMLSRWTSKSFVEMDGLWQLEQLPVLFFVFGRDADMLKLNSLVDDNTIFEFCEAEVVVNMTTLAAVAKSKLECVSHFFVVNRGQEYWAVDTANPTTSYAFDSLTKARAISLLASGSTTIQSLIGDGLPQADGEPRTSKSPTFKLRDWNGEEVAEGEKFALQILSDRDEQSDPEYAHVLNEMFDGRDWVECLSEINRQGDGPGVYGAAGHGGIYELRVVDSIAYIAWEGQFLQAEWVGHETFVRPMIAMPAGNGRLQISQDDDGVVTL